MDIGSYLMELDDGRIAILLRDGGTETQTSAMTPAEALIAFSELDYADYRKAVQQLRDEHPLFEERVDIPVSDLENFAAEAILLTADLHEIDTVSEFVVAELLLQAEDDGTAMFLLTAGWQILKVLEDPLRTQTCLRNIMEVTFDCSAGLTPAEQYEKLRGIYPDVAQSCDPERLPQLEEKRPFCFHTLMELWLVVLDCILHRTANASAGVIIAGDISFQKRKKSPGTVTE